MDHPAARARPRRRVGGCERLGAGLRVASADGYSGAQRGPRVDSRRAARRQPCGGQRHGQQQKRDHRERDRIGRRHPEQEPLQYASHAGGPHEADDEAGDDDAERAGEHETEDVAARAPSAMRTPISRVRSVTTKDSRP